MEAVSPWYDAAETDFSHPDLPVLFEKVLDNFIFQMHATDDSIWISVRREKSRRIAFRAAFAAGAGMKPERVEKTEDGADITLTTGIGKMKVSVRILDGAFPVLHYNTLLTPSKPLLFPFWPRDIFIPDADRASGKVHVQQIGARSGLLFMEVKKPKTGSLLYMQNLSSLNDFCEQTQTSCSELVGGAWPEVGFTLPVTKDKPLKKDREVVINDAFIAFDPDIPRTESKRMQQFMDLLAAVYLQMPRPETQYRDWPDILEKGLKDLTENPGCWSRSHGHSYFNAYVAEYDTPAESMVQLAVMLPLVDYDEWAGQKLKVVDTIRENLPTFYNKEIGCLMRWLPAAIDQLEEEEEQKKPLVMDSWYLHHPLLNLSRLALKGDKMAEKLFLDSLEFAIRVARHFEYEWPVFYKMDTLEVVKKETIPGRGGEKDVPGTYAQIMLQAWELTGKKRYLEEAEKAVQKLKGLGFDLLYQANNTAFAAKTLLRMWKITRKKEYLDLSYNCMANLFKNMHIWNCEYGYGKHFSSFFAVFPLRDAPYTAVYEEEEVFTSFHEYLALAEGENILPSVRLLASEFIRNLIARACFYYPPMLPGEMLAEKPKVGQLDPTLWIALEDLHDGWEKSGSVGQEVYGAGNAFGIVPRHYKRVEEEAFMLFVDYPTAEFRHEKGKSVITFKLIGPPQIDCRLRMVKTSGKPLPDFTVEWQEKGQTRTLQGTSVKGDREYAVPGSGQVRISWKG